MPPTATAVDPVSAIEDWRKDREDMPRGQRTVAALAPGAVTQELVVALARKYQPDTIIGWFDELCAACYKGQPDYRTRLAALKLMLEYLIGRPVERQEIVSVALNADSALGIEERLAKSPALREQLRRSLAAADAAAGVVDLPVEHA